MTGRNDFGIIHMGTLGEKIKKRPPDTIHMRRDTDAATLKELTRSDMDKVLRISPAIENMHSLLAGDHPNVLAANSNSNSHSKSNCGGTCKARS